MGTANAITGFRRTERQVAIKHLTDGSTVVLIGTYGDSTFRIERRNESSVVKVHETTFADEAVSVFDACDHVDRGWHPAYLPIGVAPSKAGKAVTVHAAGATIEDCLKGFLESVGEGLRAGSVQEMDRGDEREFQWGVAFVSDRTGTSFKAAGRHVPGGCVMTWWK